jgi:hypothetical protein
MKLVTSIFLSLLVTQSIAHAEDCGDPKLKHWNTVVKFITTDVTMYWTGVYEGLDSVCRIRYSVSGQSKTLDVWGQPDTNIKQSLITFLSCADDGCSKHILVADISHGTILNTELPLPDSQFYLKTKWVGAGNSFRIEVEGKTIYFLCTAGKRLTCTKQD